MGTRYANDVAYNVHLRKFSALAFCEEHDVPVQWPRTNNSVESWHNAFQGAMGMQHPDVYKLLDRLLDEQVRVKAICSKLAAGENRQLLSIIEMYDVMNADDYLEACCHYVIF
ncbi:hypothetical protein QR680_000105 [Steinernema hermaphroditum]|uniref:Uncharacterized protein n=1 Tax=Steinernema hermaphroditum TaxID=289476 RepID=A0AA39GTD2_9BILA|nr:hypothetical protein QR680_000105 [Steinernema hermaphroditum]